MAKNIKRTEVNVDAAIAGAKAFAEGAAQQKEIAHTEQQETISTHSLDCQVPNCPCGNKGGNVTAVMVNEQREDIGKIMTNDKTERCPFCKSTLLQTLPLHSYRNRRCSKCGVHFRIEPPLKRLNKTA